MTCEQAMKQKLICKSVISHLKHIYTGEGFQPGSENAGLLFLCWPIKIYVTHSTAEILYIFSENQQEKIIL